MVVLIVMCVDYTSGFTFRVSVYRHLLLSVEVAVEVPAERARWVVKAKLLVDRIDLLEVVRVQLEVSLQVGLDSALGLALRDD